MSSSPRIDPSNIPRIDDSLRDMILETPELVLEDQDLMRAIVTAHDRMLGPNVVDMRGIAMDRLEGRLDRLEETHRSVIAAAYENLAGANQVHRAVLSMLDPVAFEPFILNLGGEVADILRVDCLRLVLEAEEPEADGSVARLGGILAVTEPGFVADFLSDGRASAPDRQVTLRAVATGDPRVYGERAASIRSEACLKLDLGQGRLPGMIVLGAADPNHFTPQQGTDLLAFFAGAFERAMRRWLA